MIGDIETLITFLTMLYIAVLLINAGLGLILGWTLLGIIAGSILLYHALIIIIGVLLVYYSLYRMYTDPKS